MLCRFLRLRLLYIVLRLFVIILSQRNSERPQASLILDLYLKTGIRFASEGFLIVLLLFHFIG